MTRHARLLAGVLIAALAALSAAAQSKPPKPYDVVFGDRLVGHTEGDERGRIFYTAYTRPAPDPAHRPITFFMNGGPGASSVYLHIGGVGPVALTLTADGGVPDAPGVLAPNTDTWLDFTDLVFVDPVGTGISHALPVGDAAAKPGEFWNSDADLASLSEFIADYLVETGRGASPIAVAGASYGAYRAARLGQDLRQNYGIDLSAVILVSPWLGGPRPLRENVYGAERLVLNWPSYLAVAAAHGQVAVPGSGPAFDAAIAKAERFARADGLIGLVQLPLLSDEARAEVYAGIAAITGLAVDQVADRRGRFGAGAYHRALLADQGRLVDLYDGRRSTPVPEGEGGGLGGKLGLVTEALDAAFQPYLRDTLGHEPDRRYRILNPRVTQRFRKTGNARGALIAAMEAMPTLQVLVAHGYQDLVTPYFATRHDLEHAAIGSDALDRVAFRTYPGGHMFYVEQRAAFARDARALFQRVVGPLN